MDGVKTDRSSDDLASRVREFVNHFVLPLEALSSDAAAAQIATVQSRAKDSGLWAPQLPCEVGGLGLNLSQAFPMLEAAGRSLLGPLCLGCAAPDEGNAHVLHLAASPEQKARYLEPLAQGRIRSTFCMTEPAPGAGSDPRMMRSRAVRRGDQWVLDGHKWFSTGAVGAAFAIVACVSDPNAPPRDAMTLFLVDAEADGFEVVREVPTLGHATPGGHCEVKLTACAVDDNAVLGDVGQGYALMQRRLGPARMTHCMRWLGAATRALEIATQRAIEREAFGKTLAEHQGVGWMLSDSQTELHASRLMIADAAAKLDAGSEARLETSMCKVFVAEAVHRTIDRAIQICGSLGISTELPLAQMATESRAFRIYDGPSEVHRMVIARAIAKEAKGTKP